MVEVTQVPDSQGTSKPSNPSVVSSPSRKRPAAVITSGGSEAGTEPDIKRQSLDAVAGGATSITEGGDGASLNESEEGSLSRRAAMEKKKMEKEEWQRIRAEKEKQEIEIQRA